MAIKTINDEYLTAIGDAIREKNGEETKYLPSEMAEAIDNLPTGGGSNSYNFQTIFLDSPQISYSGGTVTIKDLDLTRPFIMTLYYDSNSSLTVSERKTRCLMFGWDKTTLTKLFDGDTIVYLTNYSADVSNNIITFRATNSTYWSNSYKTIFITYLE